MIVKSKINGANQMAIVSDWFQDEKGFERLHNALSDVLEQCVTNEETKANVQADSVFCVLRLMEVIKEGGKL
jgi:selenocysteine-specific translation elongation factor